MTLKKTIYWIITLSTISVAIFYLGFEINKVTNIKEISDIDIPISILFFSILVSTIASIFNAMLWHSINKDLNNNTLFVDSYYAWAISRIFRYIPGKVAPYIVRHKLQKTTKKVSLIASINEYLISAFPVLLMFCIYLTMMDAAFYLQLLSFFIAFVVMFLKKSFTFLFSLLKLNHEYVTQLYTSRELVYKTIYTLPAITLHGFAFFIILKFALFQPNITLFWAILSLYLAGIISQVALLVPAGLIVREATIVYLLTYIGIPVEISILASILSRIVLISCELLNIILSRSLVELKQ